jgi:hypothetical protein
MPETGVFIIDETIELSSERFIKTTVEIVQIDISTITKRVRIKIFFFILQLILPFTKTFH